MPSASSLSFFFTAGFFDGERSPKPLITRKLVSAAIRTGMASVIGSPTIRITYIPKDIGMGKTPAVTATIKQPTDSAIGISGKSRVTAVPIVPPTKNRGKIGPPIKPVEIAPAVANILANT